MSSESISIDDLLTNFGLTRPEDRTLGREALEEAKLTRAGRQNMARNKVPQAEMELQKYFVRHCGGERCLERILSSKDRRTLALVERAQCEMCGGSHIGRAVEDMAEALKAAGMSRLLIVGGTPNQHDDLRKKLPAYIQCDMVDGTGRVTLNMARSQVNRNDLLVIWAPTPLAHKVSQVYELPERRNLTVKVHRRSVTALAEAVIEWLKVRK